jgi:hypothetical protein
VNSSALGFNRSHKKGFYEINNGCTHLSHIQSLVCSLRKAKTLIDSQRQSSC